MIMNGKRTAMLAAATVTLLLTTAGSCGADPAPGVSGNCTAAAPCRDDSDTPDYGWTENHVKLSDGRTIVCISVRVANSPGISCDWGAK